MITVPRRHKLPSRGANRPLDVGVTVNINAEFNLMAVNPIIDCFSRDLIPEYCQGLESCAVYSAPTFFVEILPGRSSRSLQCLPLHMHAQAVIPTFLISNIYIGLSLPKAPSLTRLWSYEMFEVLLIVRINKRLGLRGILNFHLPRDSFQDRLVRGIPFKEGIPLPLQSIVRTPPLHVW